MSLSVHVAPQSFEWADALVNFGAVVLGASLAYFTTNRFERRKERDERRTRALELLLKLQEVVNGVLSIDRQLREGIANGEAAGVDGPVWTRLEEIAGIEDYKVDLPAADLAILARGHHYGLIQKIAELRDGHNGVVRGLAILFGMKNEVGRELRPQMRGNVAEFAADAAQIAHLGPMLANLAVLGDNLIVTLERLVPKAREVAAEFGPCMRKELRDKMFPLMVVDPPRPPEPAAQA